VKINDLRGGCCLVGENDLVGVAELQRDKEILLNRFLGLHRLASTDEEEPACTVPAFWFPGFLEEGDVAAAGGPPLSRFDLALEFHEPLERHGDGEVNGAVDEHGDDSHAEEGGVHAHFDNDAGERQSHFVDAGGDESLRIMRVVDVAGTMEQIEDLTCLGDSAEERIVAAPALVFFVIADGGVLRMPFRREDGAVEVQSDTCKGAGAQTQNNKLAAKSPKVLHTAPIGGSQDSADGGNIGEHVQAQHAFEERIVFVKSDVAQASITCQHVDDEQERDASIGKNRRTMQMFEACLQARQELQVLKELPEENYSGKGCEALVFEGEAWDGTIVAEDGLSAVFHARRFPFLSLSCLTHDNIRKTGPSRFTILPKMSNVTGCDIGC